MSEWNSPRQAERFVADYADSILRISLTYSLSREDAQDICQDIFLKLLEGRMEFADGDHERAYILRMAVNACKDLLKSARRRRNAPMEEAAQAAAPEPEDSGLRELIRTLPRHYGAALYLFDYEGYSLAEIARITGCAPAAARKRLSRGRKLLARELEVAL